MPLVLILSEQDLLDLGDHEHLLLEQVLLLGLVVLSQLVVVDELLLDILYSFLHFTYIGL